MDLFSVGFLILIVVASGVIAYAADQLGKKLGKKRFSLKVGKLSVRPRHVASIGTVSMGMITSFLTILLISILSSDVREWIVEGRKAISQNRDLLQQRNGLEKEVKEIELARDRQALETRRLETAIKDRSTELKDLKSQLDKAKVEAQRVAALRKALEGTVANLNAKLAPLEAKLQSNAAELTQLSTQLTDVRSQRARLTKAIRDSQTTLTRTAKDLNVSREEQFRMYQERVKLESNLKLQQKQLADIEAEQKRLEGEKQMAQESLSQSKNQLDGAQRELLSARKDLDTAQSRLSTLQTNISLLESVADRGRSAPMTFGQGDEVARIVVRERQSAEVVELLINSLLRSARVNAEARGAKGRKVGGQTVEAAAIIERVGEDRRWIYPDEYVRRLVQALSNRKEQVAVVASSSLNAFVGEIVSLDLQVYPNPIVYRKGQLVAEKVMDGRADFATIYEQVTQFVAESIRTQARKDKMIARIDHVEQGQSYGEVPVRDLLELVQNIKSTGRLVRTQAIARDETHAADPLRLDFRLR